MAATIVPVSLEKMATEIISEIIVLALRGCERRDLFAFCRTSRTLRRVALSTSELWMKLDTTCRVHESSDGRYISESYFEFVQWWWGRTNKRNEFALTFNIEFVDSENRMDWISLNGQPLEAILKLLTHSRYLNAGIGALIYLENALAREIYTSPHNSVDTIIPFWAQITFPFLQSIIIDNHTYEYEDGLVGYAGVLWSFLASFKMPVLQKCGLGSKLVLCHPFSKDARSTGEEIWGQLTHISIRFEGTLASWKRFLGNARSLKSARIKLTLRDADDTTVDNSAVHDRTIANLEEFWLGIICQHRVGNVLDGLRLPAVKTLLIHTGRLTLGCLHRILRATRVLERLRIQSIFPIVDLDTKRAQFSTTNDRLINLAPHLKLIMIDIRYIARSRRSYRRYVDGMRDSPWLRGQWENAPLQVALIQRSQPTWKPAVIQDLREYLESPEVSIMGGGQVDVSFRQRLESKPEGMVEQEGVPWWDLWYDLRDDF
jgi:hypothetical protein